MTPGRRQAILAAAASAALVAGIGTAGAALKREAAVDCLPRSAWSAGNTDRPCGSVRALEDGSARVRTFTRGGETFLRCTIPAPDGGRPRCRKAGR